MQILLSGYQCLRCGHQWKPRFQTLPKKCPGCDSRNWQLPPGENLPPHLEEVFQLYEVTEAQRADIIRYALQHPGVARALVEAVPELERVFGKTRRWLELDRDPETGWEELFGMIVMKSEPANDIALIHSFSDSYSSKLPQDVRLLLNFDVVTEDDYTI